MFMFGDVIKVVSIFLLLLSIVSFVFLDSLGTHVNDMYGSSHKGVDAYGVHVLQGCALMHNILLFLIVLLSVILLVLNFKLTKILIVYGFVAVVSGIIILGLGLWAFHIICSTLNSLGIVSEVSQCIHVCVPLAYERGKQLIIAGVVFAGLYVLIKKFV